MGKDKFVTSKQFCTINVTFALLKFRGINYNSYMSNNAPDPLSKISSNQQDTLRKAIQESQLSQGEVARAAGLSPSTLSRFLSDPTHHLQAISFHKVWKALRQNKESLQSTGSAEPVVYDIAVEVGPDIRRLRDIAFCLTREQRNLLNRILELGSNADLVRYATEHGLNLTSDTQAIQRASEQVLMKPTV